MPRPPLFQRATVTRIVQETADARTYVLAPHEGPFEYRAGQFCTFRVRLNGTELLRSYSMSSAPETDSELMTTVKRIPGGQVSNWLHESLTEGDEVELTRPAGVFCLRETDAPLLGFAGGSGITPILSLAKSALATTGRRVRLLCADRDRDSMIFDKVLTDLAKRFPARFSVLRHLDVEHGWVNTAAVREFVGADGDGDCYVCGPTPFMDIVEAALPGPGRIMIERFGGDAEAPAVEPGGELDGTVTIVLGRKRASVPRHAGETLLESARRAGLLPPFSCEAGNCATCIAQLTEGHATMRVNDALTEEEVAEGYVLTCQGVPDTPSATVVYE
ncbi:ferredoxin--NADP reductase [Catenulispora rubra]|uniref:ferredoxin--NADP reductase n=1 Tax=Catenulispora rubra TaxID=280293 RepID=UPI0018924B6D|nr:ferredoxin--NADP reductase [Catenulispora rubra]